MDQILHDNIKETRIESLFTKDLSELKEVNPDGYAANLANWELVINEFINHRVFPNSLTIDTEDLNNLSINVNGQHLKIKNGVLDVVINHMINVTGQLVPVSRFESQPLDKSLINKFIYKVISSTVYNLDYDISARGKSLKKDSLVSIGKLKEVSLQIYDFYKYEYLTTEEYSDYVIGKAHFQDLIKKFEITDLDFKLVLIYLSRDLKKIMMKGDVIKFVTHDKDEIDENDESISLLKSTTYKLNNLIRKLSIKQTDLKNEIMKNLADGNKKYAKILLQNYKKIEINLLNQSVQLNNLTTLLDQINQQSFNKTLISTITTNSQLLNKLNQTTDLDNLQKVLDTMSDNINESDKITELLSSTTSSAADDKQVDKELQELIDSSNAQKLSEQASNKKDDELNERFQKLKTGSLGKTELGIDDGSAKTSTTDQGKTEIGKTEVGKTEAGKTEVGKTEIGKTEAGKTEVGKTETGTVEKEKDAKKEDKLPVYA